jgi:hypothetical protein
MLACWGMWQQLHREVEEETQECAGGQGEGHTLPSDVIASAPAHHADDGRR